MQTRLTLKPGDRGTRKLRDYYGDRLVCVRYRYDPATKKRFKTAEIIVDEQSWQPLPDFSNSDDEVALIIDYTEKSLREQVKSAGGRWVPEEKCWLLPRKKVYQLKLQHRIIDE